MPTYQEIAEMAHRKNILDVAAELGMKVDEQCRWIIPGEKPKGLTFKPEYITASWRWAGTSMQPSSQQARRWLWLWIGCCPVSNGLILIIVISFHLISKSNNNISGWRHWCGRCNWRQSRQILGIHPLQRSRHCYWTLRLDIHQAPALRRSDFGIPG